MPGIIPGSETSTPVVLLKGSEGWPDGTVSQSQRRWLLATGFKGEAGQVAYVPDGGSAIAFVAAGADVTSDPIWAAAGLPMSLPEGRYHFTQSFERDAATAIATGMLLGSYQFNAYRAAKRGPAIISPPAGADLAEAQNIAASVALARDLINTPAEDMGPDQLADACGKVALAYGATVQVIRGDDLLAQDYPLIHAVGRASNRPPLLIDMKWGNPSHPQIALVGKGICFDTGGLAIKPLSAMLEMKKDMSGGAIMLGLARAIMEARLPVRLRLLIPAADNAISGPAMRPRDIFKSRGGKTVEIVDTDAEGRLVLADALSEARAGKPDIIVDAATLTGAAKTAMGADVQAFFTNREELAPLLVQAGRDVSDPLWPLPLWRGYRRALDSKIADMTNSGAGPMGAAIVAALFLAEFAGNEAPWVHLDVMAQNTSPRPGRPEGGEATGMRALFAYLKRRYA